MDSAKLDWNPRGCDSGSVEEPASHDIVEDNVGLGAGGLLNPCFNCLCHGGCHDRLGIRYESRNSLDRSGALDTWKNAVLSEENSIKVAVVDHAIHNTRTWASTFRL